MSAHHRRSCSADAVRTAREGGTDADGEAMTSGSPHPAPAGGPGKHATSGPMSIAPPTAVPASAPRQTPTANRTPVLRTAAPGPWPDPQHWPPARAVAKTQSQRCWRRLLHVLTRINVGLSPDELYESGLHLRIRRNVPHAYQIGIFGIKGGVGRTTVTVALGSALSRIRGDRILAIDADPGGGNLADRARRQSRATVADLLADKHLLRYNDIRTYASMNGDKLEVLPAAEFTAQRVARSTTSTGRMRPISCRATTTSSWPTAGLLQPAARGALSTVSAVVIVGSASVDDARQAAATLDWLRQNGYQHCSPAPAW
ncbi:MAG: ATPase involved in chromosome partitioning [Mycobacterium sp.]|nr:ATPase involved in chromosome partitioning [Mycobacterium sp.]